MSKHYNTIVITGHECSGRVEMECHIQWLNVKIAQVEMGSRMF